MVSRKRNAAAALILWLFAALGAARAQEDPEALAEARRLIEVSDYTDVMRLQLDQIGEIVVQAWIQANPGLEGEVRRAMDELILPELKAVLPNLIDDTARVYAQELTADELREVIAFYDSAVGRKLVEKLPELMQATTALSQYWGEHAARAAMDRHIGNLRARGLKAL